MSEAEIAWLAGLFEGEGYTSRRTLAIAMTDLDVLERVAAITCTRGALRGPYTYKAASRAQCKPYYRWQPDVMQSQALVRLILPLLGVRRKRQLRAMEVR